MALRIEPSDRIGELVTRHPEAIACFNEWQVDFSCGGDRTLATICQESGIPFATLAQTLTQLGSSPAPEVDWSERTLGELTRRLIDHYHVQSRQRLSAMQRLSLQISIEGSAGGLRIERLRKLLDALREDLFPHMLKEEMVLFPWVERLSKLATGEPIDRPFFDSVRNPVNMMALEHEYVAELLGEVRHLTRDFEHPPEADPKVVALCDSLRDFEELQRLHIHLENNVFFPRSIALEDSVTIV